MLSLKSERIPRAEPFVALPYVQVFVQGSATVWRSSGPLAEVHVNAFQVRKDLAYLANSGVRGGGHNVASLIAAIKASLC